MLKDWQNQRVLYGAGSMTGGLQAEKGRVVAFDYILRDADSGEEIERSDEGSPNVYLHGHRNVLPGLEEAVAGKQEGDAVTVTLPPERAYGLRQDNSVHRVPIKHLVFRGKLKPGMVVQLNTDQGRRSVTVLKAGRHSADIDANPPLAGQAVRFDIEIVGVRAADPEEVSHGHAHGPGGHQH